MRAAESQLNKLRGKAPGDLSHQDFDRLVAEIDAARRETLGPRPRSKHGHGAKARILDYLRRNVGEPVTGEELRAISGIQEWARRIRELRVEDGFDIQEVGRSTYVLTQAEPDADRAAQWQLANRIRNESGSARDRIGRFLTAYVGQTVTRDQIDYVGKIKEGSRRLRELRDEHGWPIETHIDDPSLKPSEYRLLSTDPADRRDPSQRLYPDSLRQQIFERDGYTCQICKRNREKAEAAGDERFYLELHHKVAIADELASLPASDRDRPEHLITLCHSDHIRETEKLQRRKRKARKRT
jgi:hypothetical protein